MSKMMRRDERRSSNDGGGVPGWLITGLVVAGLGYFAWKFIGPDLRRYMKIRSM
jgi:hypothetical protein